MEAGAVAIGSFGSRLYGQSSGSGAAGYQENKTKTATCDNMNFVL